jgi:two-component system sensor kinase ParS
MFSLLRRIALSVTVALVVSLVAMTALIQLTNDQKMAEVGRHVAGMGARLVARELSRTPVERRPARLAEMAIDLEFRMRIEDVPGRAPGPSQEPSFEAREDLGPPSMVFRLDERQQLVVRPPLRLGPPPAHGPRGGPEPHEGPRWRRPPPPGRGGPHGRPHGREGEGWLSLPPFVPALPLLAFLAVTAVGASLLVGVPLVRRLRRIGAAIESLSEANFDVIIEGPRGDAIGAVADSLERSARRLQGLFSERVELLQAVSHEIGTPLSRMRFQLEALERADTPEARRPLLRALDGEVRELDELSSELISWVEADAARLDRRTLDVRASLAQLVEVESLSSERPLSITLDAPESLSAEVEPRQFLRAIENLLRNAVRYAAGSVVIRAGLDGGALTVTVEDDGPGIAPEDRERVLQPFVRLDAARSRERGGTGLGLAIVRRVVERHRGTITIERSDLGGAAIQTRWPPP